MFDTINAAVVVVAVVVAVDVAVFFDIRGQFYQYFKSSFCADILSPEKYKPKIYGQKKLGAKNR
jgi:hypothetical protein